MLVQLTRKSEETQANHDAGEMRKQHSQIVVVTFERLQEVSPEVLNDTLEIIGSLAIGGDAGKRVNTRNTGRHG
jgi:hypothetical protein